MTKKKIFVVALAIALIAILSAGSLAWFSDMESVENNFLFATTDDDTEDKVFNVELTETEAPAGKQYKDIQPGDLLDKNPTITNTGYYNQYIRVTVTIKNAAKFEEYIMANDSTFDADVFVGFDNTKWIADTDADKGGYAGHYDQTPDTRTYTFYYNGILAGEQTTATDKVSSVTLFTDVKIPSGLTREQAAAINAAAKGNTSFDITIKADAVQTENVGATATATGAENAKTAFTTVGV